MTSNNKKKSLSQKLNSFFRLDYKKSFYGVIIILLVTPIAYALFLMWNASLQKLGVVALMKQQPLVAVMTIVACLDIISGYSLWMIRTDVLSNRSSYRIIMTAIMLQQFAVSNLIAGFCSVLAIALSGSVQSKSLKNKVSLWLEIVILTSMYLFCLYAFMKLKK